MEKLKTLKKRKKATRKTENKQEQIKEK